MTEETVFENNMETQPRMGRYRLLQQLGQGAAALVYKAHDPEIDRTLAIKVLRPDDSEAAKEFQKRFMREARAAGNLSHPNIVTIHDVGIWKNRPYMVMELIKGEPLDQIMKQGAPLPITKVVGFGIQLAEALDYAHQHGVVHRDIKPSNIIRIGDSDRVKLTDFGIARTVSDDDNQYTRTGQVLGTPQYMSPEQILGLPMDGRSDLFSLGVVLYQLLSGQKAFSGDTLGSLFQKITMEPHQPLANASANVPAPLAAAVDRLLEKKPSNRFQTGMELAQALRSLIPALSASTASTVFTEINTAPPARKSYGALGKYAAGAGIFFLLALSYGLAQRYSGGADSVAEVPQTPTQSSRATDATPLAVSAQPATAAVVQATSLPVRATVPSDSDRAPPATIAESPTAAPAAEPVAEAVTASAHSSAGALSFPADNDVHATAIDDNKDAAVPVAADPNDTRQPPANTAGAATPTVATRRDASTPAGKPPLLAMVKPKSQAPPAPEVPRISVIITEKNAGGAWHISSDASVAQAENIVITALGAKDVDIVDYNAFSKTESLLDLIAGNQQRALLQQAAQAGISHLIIGQLIVRDEGSVAGSPLHSYYGSLNMRLVKTSNGRILDTYSRQTKQADNNIVTAQDKFYRQFLAGEFRTWITDLALK